MKPLELLQELRRRDRVFPFIDEAPPPHPRLDTRHGPILYVEGITKSFDGFKALDDLTLYVGDGELRCLIGPNGAGKTTLMDVITGKTQPDTGHAWFGQRLNLLRMNEHDIAQAGIGRKFQKPTVYENLTVHENLELAMHAHRGLMTSLFWRLDGEQRDRVDEILELIGLKEEGHRAAGLLSHGQKQWLEVGSLLMQNPRLLLVDEPVAGMTPAETEATAELLVSLAGKHSVVVVEHDMEFVRSIARTVTVLHQGSVLAEGTMDQVQNDPKVREVYLGEEA
ncbi:urea ABC transporter ATP-binding protein UrtD [Alkalilimnicola ehrlichii MLHE-1]|uniref:ABC transporter related protein n=1 Tax=Alkalilimnicola ehrlichii (strain ATCC BAA-1101 / DSM 17681 / MLHE-1) TaxID=187272 RepID=Q0AC91_ALKEH|nr:urea ABC transporter ATP-binding protein UrtD [Alkalilimnicola ehrlichii]ABI55546.1 ABC transporter related protein [Alkalilimnicola ehrlichii MLHE-1]